MDLEQSFEETEGYGSNVGDDIYYNNGAHNNLRIMFGPVLRF